MVPPAMLPYSVIFNDREKFFDCVDRLYFKNIKSGYQKLMWNLLDSDQILEVNPRNGEGLHSRKE